MLISDAKKLQCSSHVEMKKQTVEIMKIDKFTLFVKELAIYLGRFGIDYTQNGRSCLVTDIKDYEKGIHDYVEALLCPVSEKEPNKYYITTVEVIFRASRLSYNGNDDRYNMIEYGGSWEELKEFYGYSKQNYMEWYTLRTWREDIKYPEKSGENILRKILHRISNGDDFYWSNHVLRYYNVFWNLFLLTLDDKIYETQLNKVIELACYCDFDEPMMRDWCRAVEYVLEGNKLSEECDFECETVEGLEFFLHRDIRK